MAGGKPVSPFGILTLHVEPADAQVFIDGELWLGLENRTDLVIHIPQGWHQLEIRKDGYQTFKTEIGLSEGGATRLNIRLAR
jgi:hypothetical protein